MGGGNQVGHIGAQAATLGVEAGAVVYGWENAGSVP